MAVLDFERPLVELAQRIEALRAAEREGGDDDVAAQVAVLETQARALEREVFGALGPWEKVQLSRHPDRPYTLDYVSAMFTDFVELHGDRCYGDDAAVVGGLARFRGEPVVVIGHQKGRGVKENVRRNFGMPHPEGYRKALRLMELADRFRRPLVTLIDTPGAFPGLGAEERGQGEAIGRCLAVMSGLRVPVIAVVIGEGGSGGALALGVANRVLMLEFATYSVITPEGCASILWKDSARAPEAAEAMKVTAEHCLALGVADELIAEPPGGAHRDPAGAAARVAAAVARSLDAVKGSSPEQLVEARYARFKRLASYASG
ncbi:MAG: acetyl-CoA carboxylase carboxyltransferase subunit alpha [Polyangiales bacterium]